jgi:hypothetical protein
VTAGPAQTRPDRYRTGEWTPDDQHAPFPWMLSLAWVTVHGTDAAVDLVARSSTIGVPPDWWMANFRRFLTTDPTGDTGPAIDTLTALTEFSSRLTAEPGNRFLVSVATFLARRGFVTPDQCRRTLLSGAPR